MGRAVALAAAAETRVDALEAGVGAAAPAKSAKPPSTCYTC